MIITICKNYFPMAKNKPSNAELTRLAVGQSGGAKRNES